MQRGFCHGLLEPVVKPRVAAADRAAVPGCGLCTMCSGGGADVFDGKAPAATDKGASDANQADEA